MTRLLIRGGSIAAGVGVSPGYADLLREHYEPLGVEFINRSRPGETSFDAIDRFDEDIASFLPDVLVLHFAVDDAFAAVYRSEFKENLVQIIRRARKEFRPQIFLLTSHPFEDPYEMEAVNIYYRAIREVAMDLACSLIPLHTAWAGHLQEQGVPGSAFLQKDVRLPNEEGHRFYASLLIRHLDGIV